MCKIQNMKSWIACVKGLFIVWNHNLMHYIYHICQINAPAWINTPLNCWLWLAISQKLFNQSESYFQHIKLFRCLHMWHSSKSDKAKALFSATAPGAFIRPNTVNFNILTQISVFIVTGLFSEVGLCTEGHHFTYITVASSYRYVNGVV